MGCEKTADELFPKLLLVATFLGVATILLWAVTPIVQTGTMMNDPSMDWSEIGIFGYAYYDPHPFEVSNATVKDRALYPDPGPSETFTSDVPHRHDIKAYVVRDNFYYTVSLGNDFTWWSQYRDCFVFIMDLESIVLQQVHKTKWAVIPFETVQERADYIDNSSQVDFSLNADYSLFVSTGPGMPLLTGLWGNEFNMSIGWSLNLSASASASPWGLVGQILTFSIPNVSPLINMLIAIPIYLTMGFLVVAIISRFLPTTSGL